MKNVLEQAEKLANSILDSEVYVNMRLSEQAAMHSQEAVDLMTNFMEKRQEVESILSTSNMDHAALASASQAMEDAEAAMNSNTLINKMQQDRATFTDMMGNVNKIIRFVVTGEEEEEHTHNHDCGGSCSGCSGCGH